MQLRTFYVKSYRSIVEGTIQNIGDYSVIVGPNNSGKSNLLRAVLVSLSIALDGDFRRVRRNRQYSYAYTGDDYNWDRDIPTSLRDEKDASTIFKLTFEFSQADKDEFKEQFGISLSKSLQMKFELFKDKTEYNIIMPGKAKKPMEEKIREIGLFIRGKLDYQYIPCVRSSEFTAEYFQKLLKKELMQLEQNPVYLECIEKIRLLQKPIVDRLEDRLTTSLKTFMPNINSVKLDANYQLYDFSFISRKNYSYSSSAPINIDDGNFTSLDDKGDGVKSLTAISIVQSMSFEKAGGRALILCIEEPEAHLHPDAIHSLRNIILEIAEKEGVQVIITTHSPLLADRNNVSNNVVVHDNHRIKCCEAISEVREVLGVRTTDNMVAKKVVLVEGESDKRYLTALCRALDDVLKNKLESGDLEIVNVNSSTKMDYQIILYNSQMIPSIVLLDSDDSGLDSQKQLIDSKTKLSNEILMIKSAGMRKCELEDIVSFDEYLNLVRDKYNIELDTRNFKRRDHPWSDRLKKAAERSAGIFNDEIEASIKEMIADIVCEKNIAAIASYDREYIESLINAIKSFAK